MTVEELLAAHKWKPIPNCPERFVLVTPEPDIVPVQMAQVDRAPLEFRVTTAKDIVVVLPLEGGGRISYRRPDGTYLHTLNDEAGFVRKLAQLAISLD